MYKVYIAKLKRLIGTPKVAALGPRVVMKVGITSSSDAMDRINYRGDDELYPITNYFQDNKIMKATPRIYSKEDAQIIERYIMDAIRGDDKYFHNWYEEDQISGITEMRIWNYDEFLKAVRVMDDIVALKA